MFFFTTGRNSLYIYFILGQNTKFKNRTKHHARFLPIYHYNKEVLKKGPQKDQSYLHNSCFVHCSSTLSKVRIRYHSLPRHGLWHVLIGLGGLRQVKLGYVKLSESAMVFPLVIGKEARLSVLISSPFRTGHVLDWQLYEKGRTTQTMITSSWVSIYIDLKIFTYELLAVLLRKKKHWQDNLHRLR